MVKAIADPAIQKRLQTLGNKPLSCAPEEFAARVEGDVARWTKLILELNL